MKLAIVALLVSGATAFTPSIPYLATRSAVATQVFAEPENEEGGLDLDLEEMFDMFDAADKGQDFDKAIKEVKKEKEE
eukprot:CAMPEP_0171329718 /NCGR_PEP_ID=MMETSP0878-20121228/1491_1 /TAXON_ID=67004 /ORGANISM="Thalassiosira weissflogii, Strain CCMP1336" /LENGTH=77 /DNA_ID=CAMNT_0011829823 /DNA_START=54 /DNA_END=287 /DNA_ORIENTATION=-